MPLPVFTASYEPSGDDLATLQPVFAYKTANQDTGANNTTFADDTHLSVAGLAGATYTVDTYFQVQGAGAAATGNFKYQWRLTSVTNSDFWWSGEGMATNDIAAGTAEGRNSHLATRVTASTPSGTQIFGTPSANWAGIIGRGLWIVGSVASTLILQWAQSVNSATASVMRAGSWVKLVRVG